MEEVKSCTHLMLQLGAGCTAPPPTPARMSVATEGVSPEDDIFWSTAPCLRPPFGAGLDFVEDVVDDVTVGSKCGSSGSMCRSSTPPSRADLDDLALYLMQQSLLSTPTLLPSPTLRRQKRGISAGSVAATVQSSCNEQETHCLVVGSRLPSTYSFSMEGFCEESKTIIQRSYEEDGAIFVQITDVGQAFVMKVDHLFKQCPSMNETCLFGSCALLPISKMLMYESSTITSCQQENGVFELSFKLPLSSQDAPTAEALMDADFREAMGVFTKLMVEISKELFKLLLEDKIRNKLGGHFLSPELYIYKHGGEVPRISRHDEDLVLSVISRGNHQGLFKKESFLAILGSQIQAWSKGKFRPPTWPSLCSLVEEEVCIQFDLVYHP
ncbi:hypothetical protein L7F22_024906 [Adiantum nelumboides]|nr:hypothetical protein [Adiantum nelumboides]